MTSGLFIFTVLKILHEWKLGNCQIYIESGTVIKEEPHFYTVGKIALF